RNLKQVFKEPYKNVVVPILKWQLSKELNRLHELSGSENPTVDWNLEEDDSQLAQIIRHLNGNLGVGESILYTERASPSVMGSIGTSIMGTPVHLSISGGVDMVDIRRIQIYRKDSNTFQIYDDFGHGKGWSM